MKQKVKDVFSAAYRSGIKSATNSSIYPDPFFNKNVFWFMGSFCVINNKSLDSEPLIKRFTLQYILDSLMHAGRVLEFKIKLSYARAADFSKFNLPCFVVLQELASQATKNTCARQSLIIYI